MAIYICCFTLSATVENISDNINKTKQDLTALEESFRVKSLIVKGSDEQTLSFNEKTYNTDDFVKTSLHIGNFIVKYNGMLKDGSPEGFGMGAFFDKNTGKKYANYTGEWSNGQPNGVGKMTPSKEAAAIKDNDTYFGEFKDGMRYGAGITESEGEIFIGHFKNDKRDGMGIVKNKSPRDSIVSFLCDWEFGKVKPTREAEVVYDDQSFYHGEIDNKVRKNGTGTLFKGVSKIGHLWKDGSLIQGGE